MSSDRLRARSDKREPATYRLAMGNMMRTIRRVFAALFRRESKWDRLRPETEREALKHHGRGGL